MTTSGAIRMTPATKLDRRPAFVESLLDLGEERAEAFLRTG